MEKVQLYNRRIQSPMKKPYVIFDNKKIPLKKLSISEIIKVRGKPYSVYFYAPIKKGLRTE